MGLIWRYTGFAIAAVAILGGALLTMGHLRSQEAEYTQAELAKLKAMSSSWETRLTSVRAAFRDQVWRQNVGPMLEHPEEWVSWRAEEKLREIESSWMREYGALRGIGLFTESGALQAAIGESGTLQSMLATFADAVDSDLIVTDTQSGTIGYVAVRYAPSATADTVHPGSLIALFDRESVLTVPDAPPTTWILMGGPKRMLLASTASLEAPFQKTTWNILLSERSGVVPQADGTPFGFCRLQIPGMPPMMLLTQIRTPASAAEATTGMALFAGGALAMTLLFAIRRRPAPSPDAQADSTEPTPKGSETVTFRQIFQAVRQPLCVVDSRGRLMRVNTAGRELLRVQKGGRPNPELAVLLDSGDQTIEAFFERLSQDNRAFPGVIILSLNGERIFTGTVETTRLYTDYDGRGPVMVEFRESQDQQTATPSATDSGAQEPESLVDENSPYPILCVGEDGLVRAYNEAAAEVCPRLKDTPLLADVLPGIERRELPEFLAETRDQRFESLFGTALHEFSAIRDGDDILLYGVEKSDTRAMKIALEQAQESFNSLCALSPSAVLLMDPWSHLIRHTNAGAASLFGLTPFDLQDRSLDEFMEITWDEPSAQKELLLTKADGSTMICRFSHDLIKVEGEPAVLAVIEPLYQPVESDARDLADHAQAMAGAVQEQLRETVWPLGPGLLIVNNPTVREVARRMLEKTGHVCETFSSLDDATAWMYANELRPEVAVVDLSDFDNADEWLTMVRDRCGEVPCLALTGGGDYPLPDGGLNCLLEKPFELESLTRSLVNLNLEIEAETAG